MVEVTIFVEVGIKYDGTEITNGGFFVTRIKCNLSTKIGAVNDTAMVLRATNIAGVFKGDPWVTRLKNHAEHGLPKVDCGALLPKNFAALSHGFVFAVAIFKCFTVKIVEIRALIRAKECPILTSFHPFHEEVRNPISRVHVVSPAAVVSSVFAKLEEIVDVVVPCLEVSATRATALDRLLVDRPARGPSRLLEGKRTHGPALTNLRWSLEGVHEHSHSMATARSLAHRPARLLACLPACTSMHACLLSRFLTCLFACVLAWLPASLLARSVACLIADGPA